MPFNKTECKKIYEELDTLIKEVQSGPVGLDGYAKWIRKNPNFKGTGKSSCTTKRTELKAMLEDTKGDKGDYRRIYKKANACIDALKAFLRLHHQDDFSERRYEVLFYYMKGSDSEPMLGRAVLTTETGSRARLENIKDNWSPNYEGTYVQMLNRVLVFDFDAIGGAKRKMRLEILYNNPDHEWLVGAYATIEYNHIVTGTVVLQRRNKNRKVEPKVLSIFNTPEEFGSYPKPVLHFLARRKYNYHVLPNEIGTVDDIAEKVELHSRFEKTRTRFFEIGPPRVFIAAPDSALENKQSKINKKAVEEIVKNIEETCNPDKDNPSIHLFFNSFTQEEALGMLKLTRYFILIITKTQKSSFSLIQLGWAFAYCTNILVFYEEDSISKKIWELRNTVKEGVKFVEFKNLSKNKEHITEEITNYLDTDIKRLKRRHSNNTDDISVKS